jgi:hypothetical protein
MQRAVNKARRQMKTIAPEQLPDPWLVDSAYLLKELSRIRELTLQIPLTIEASLPQNSVIDALWRLEEQLRYLLRLHAAGQSAFAARAQGPRGDGSAADASESPRVGLRVVS